MAKAPGNSKLTANFILDRETKGAFRYNEVDQQGNPITELSGAIYLRKSALGGKAPKAIRLTVEGIEG